MVIEYRLKVNGHIQKALLIFVQGLKNTDFDKCLFTNAVFPRKCEALISLR